MASRVRALNVFLFLFVAMFPCLCVTYGVFCIRVVCSYSLVSLLCLLKCVCLVWNVSVTVNSNSLMM